MTVDRNLVKRRAAGPDRIRAQEPGGVIGGL
jgi:hypothetical protein